MNRRDWTSYQDQPFTEEELAEVDRSDELDPKEASELLKELELDANRVYKGSVELADGTVVRPEEEEIDPVADATVPAANDAPGHITWITVSDLFRWIVEIALVFVGDFESGAIVRFVIASDGLNAVDRVYAKFGTTVGNKFMSTLSVLEGEPRLLALMIAACFLVLELIIAIVQGVRHKMAK